MIQNSKLLKIYLWNWKMPISTVGVDHCNTPNVFICSKNIENWIK